MKRKYVHKGKAFTVEKSNRKNKQLKATFKDGKVIHFGDPKMPEYPGTKRGDNYCTRSAGIKTADNIKSANELSRKILWNCKGNKSMKTLKEAKVKRIRFKELKR
jgi:hypothetical protein